MQTRRTKSRLARRESRIFMRQTLFFILAIVAALYLLLRLGVPVLIKLAILLGDVRSESRIGESGEKPILLAPRLNALPEATSSATIAVSGYTQENLAVTLYVNNTPLEGEVTGADGGFEFPDVGLRQGKNLIWATAADSKGNTSAQSEEMAVTLDNTAPKLTIDSPRDGQEFNESSSIAVEGLTDETAHITVNGLLAQTHTDGSFSKTITLTEGENNLEISARDPAGNETKINLKVSYTPQ